jgi:hypothetical protein
MSFAINSMAICAGGSGSQKSWFGSSNIHDPLCRRLMNHTICLPQ